MNPRVKAVQYHDPTNWLLHLIMMNKRNSNLSAYFKSPFINLYKTRISAARQKFIGHSSLGWWNWFRSRYIYLESTRFKNVSPEPPGCSFNTTQWRCAYSRFVINKNPIAVFILKQKTQYLQYANSFKPIWTIHKRNYFKKEACLILKNGL